MARPKHVPLPEDKLRAVEYLASRFCSDEEIAYAVDISENTLKRHYGPLLTKGRANGRSSLRRAQVELALGKPSRAAEFLRAGADGKGDLVLDKNGEPILLRPSEEAVKPNATMQVWLGKQLLRQREPWLAPGEKPPVLPGVADDEGLDVTKTKGSTTIVYTTEWGNAAEPAQSGLQKKED